VGAPPSTLPSRQFPRLQRAVGSVVGEWNRIGKQAQFFAEVLALIPKAAVRYRAELLRSIANMGMGTGALAIIGGAVGVFGVIVFANGILVGVLATNQLGSIGVDALTGLAGSILNLRFMVPGTCIVALTATVGAGATAHLGAMRINEEIDALEVIGVRSIAYLASIQVIAGTVAMVPLYCSTAIMGFLGTRITTVVFQKQGSGVYDHYFNTFFDPHSMLWSFSMTMAMSVVIMLVHTYYGYNAGGGPAGVGEAVGRSVRTSLVIAVVGLVMISLAVYGQSGSFHLAS
jgi:phospholipid/cholesterol/gamma-HCH transport system permease protein